MKLFLYSHTHWDREWYLSQNQFQWRLVRTLDEIIELLEEDSSFDTFVLDGQTSVLSDYLALRPERRELLCSLVRAGRLVIGPWYTMPDTFLPDGESLIRNLQRGHRDCQSFGALFPNTGYVPDSFGHIEQLPQLLRGMGIDNFIFSRGRPVIVNEKNGYTREFRWQAPDGSEVLAWFLPGSYCNAMFLPNPRKESEQLRRRLQDIIESYRSSTVPEVVLAAHGIDHCWLQRDIAEIIDAIPELFPDVELQYGSLQAAIDEWKCHADAAQLKEYCGQLRGRLGPGELHNTLSSRIDNKIANEKAQMFVQNLAEPLEAIAVGFGYRETPWIFDKAWRLLFENHAHDSICGCSQDRVHRDVNTRFRECVELAADSADAALDYLNNPARRAGKPSLIAFAGLAGGNRLVDFVLRQPIDALPEFCLEDAEGRRYAAQVEKTTRLKVVHTNGKKEYRECRGVVAIPDFQPCELRVLQFCLQEASPAVADPVRCTEHGMENRLVRIEFNADGSFNIHNLQTGTSIENTHCFVQEGDIGGGYHFEPVPEDCRRTTQGGVARIRCLHAGPLRSTFEIDYRLSVPSHYDRVLRKRSAELVPLLLTTRVSLETGSARIDCRTTIQNRSGHQRLRLLCPTGMEMASFHADAAFALHENSIGKWQAEERYNTHPMRNLVAAEASGQSLGILTRGLHEYEIMPDNSVEITLLRSVDFVFQCCTWETPEAQLGGGTTVEYALLPYSGGWQEAGVPREIAAYRNPGIANTHGDEMVPNPQQQHATIGFYAVNEEGVELPVDSNRSCWKPYNAERDGWRRVENDRFVDSGFDGRFVPFQLRGENLLVSAYKRAEDGAGDILRIWNASKRVQEAEIVAADSAARIGRVDLLERPESTTQCGVGSFACRLRPFEIATFRLD